MNRLPPQDRLAEHSPERAAKFRQAAFTYLHYGLLYEAAVWAIHQAGALPEGRGGVVTYMIAGAVIGALVVAGLWFWQNPWLARVIWAVVAFRLPALISGAFLGTGEARIAPGMYLTALIVVLVNMWMLARAGWDL